MKFNRQTIFIILFSLLYICVGFVSTYHAISFFSLANTMFLAIMLACTFEVGQATVLFSILSSKKDRSKFMPWILMTILTFVQVLGNVFSTYKYLMTNSIGELKYFKEPVLWWAELPDQTCNVILTYIIGAILPIVALCMTGMVEQFINDKEDVEKNNGDPNDDPNDDPDGDLDDEPINEEVEDGVNEHTDDEPEETLEDIREQIGNAFHQIEEPEEDVNEQPSDLLTPTGINPIKIDDDGNAIIEKPSEDLSELEKQRAIKETKNKMDEELQKVVIQPEEKNNQSSHFINLK